MVMEERPTKTKPAILIQILWYSRYHDGYLVKAVSSLAVMASCVSVI